MPDEPSGAVCVFCRRKPVDPDWRPFCSERCQLRDLAHWADGTYRVPGEQAELDERSEPGTQNEEDTEH